MKNNIENTWGVKYAPLIERRAIMLFWDGFTIPEALEIATNEATNKFYGNKYE